MKKTILIAFVATLFFGNSARAETPIGIPYSVWSKTEYDQSGKLLHMTHAEIGADWFKIGEKTKFNTFIGADASKSNEIKNYWENEVSPEIGFKVVHSFTPSKGGYGSFEVGVKYKTHFYFEGADGVDHNNNGCSVFVSVNFGGDLLNGRKY